MAGSNPASDTPALANPKIGRIRNDDHGWIACSRMCSGEVGSSGLPTLRRKGIVSASSTPAIVAWMPDLSTNTHKTTPSSR